ncbi:protein draper-like [Neocloeon triangulifer]|uniref:protein draper-like n=1 Tax=Neocloeon triangulifer TaxID=2078957 RepID=UPI00286F21DF|nr:protein draper-like [Neocloeon triangulifer]
MKSSLLQIVVHFFLISYSASTDLSGVRCERNEDCTLITDATCNLNLKLCECAGYQVLNSTMQSCLPVPSGAGGTCKEDVQCSAVLLNGGTCTSGKCGCVDGMHYLKGRCWPSKMLGSTCDFDEECVSVLEANAVQCIENKCQCSPGFYQREYSDCRKKAENVGEPCALNSDCVFEGSFCNTKTKVCECISGAGQEICNLKNKVTKDFLPANYTRPLTTSDMGKELGSPCTPSGAECGIANSECSALGYCVCKNGFFKPAGEEKCVPEIGGPCVQNADCAAINGSNCDGTMCVCGVGTAASVTKQECLTQITLINNKCNETSQCTLFGARAQCRLNGNTKTCKCDDFSRVFKEDSICWIAKWPGEQCADARDCSATSGDTYVSCVEGTCSCINGYHPSSDKKDCYLDVPNLGGVCKENGDCEVQFSVCDSKSKKCACQPGYYKVGNACRLGVGGPCSVQDDCATAADAVCTANKCQCPSGWTANLATSACLPIGGGLDALCSENQQCTPSLGEFGECSEEQCRCRKRHHLVDGTCTPSKGLGDDCTKGSECFLPVSSEGVICRNNKCSCDYGLVPAENNDYCSGSAALQTARFVLVNIALLVSVLLR